MSFSACDFVDDVCNALDDLAEGKATVGNVVAICQGARSALPQDEFEDDDEDDA